MLDTIVWSFSTVMLVLTVTLHYQVMAVTSDKVIPWTQKRIKSRRVMAYGIACLLFGHILEIWLYALAIKLTVFNPALGSVQGEFTNAWSDFLYLSTISYTTLGDNSIHLTGPARALAASESLVGLMMILWSASFSYLKMKSIWERRKERRDKA